MHFILFYFTFLLLKLSLRSCFHTHCHCIGTTAMVYARGMTTQPHPQAHKPPHHHHILSLAPIPTTAIASFIGMQVMFFSFLFFCPFSDQCYRDSLPHMLGPQTPTSPHIIPTTMLCPSSLASPPTIIAFIHRHASKVMFFFFFFFFYQFCRDLFFPLSLSSNPPPLHHAFTL